MGLQGCEGLPRPLIAAVAYEKALNIWRLFFFWTNEMALSGLVCGPADEPGVTYAEVGGQHVKCGTDSSGKEMLIHVAVLSDSQPVTGGEIVGLQIGGAVLGVMAVAWCIRAIRNHFDSTGEA